MSELYARNLEALARRDAELAQSLASVEVSLAGVTVEKSATGRPHLRLATGSARMALEDETDPAAAARRKIGELDEKIKLVVVKGAGLGYLWKAAQARRSLERIVCIEPQKALFALMLGFSDMRRVFDDPRVEIQVGGDPGAFPRSCRKRYDCGTEAGRLLVVLPHNAVLRHPVMLLSAEFDHAFDAEWNSVSVVSERNRTTLETFVHIWRGNILANLSSILASSPVTSLRSAAAGRPGILVGAGPSLDVNVAELRNVKDRAVIVAVDTACRTLHQHGITPHIVIAVDATEENVGDFHGVEIHDDLTSLVMVPVVHPSIPPLFRRRYVASYGHPLQKELERVIGAEFGSLLVSGSVATIGYDLLRYMGARPVILAGMDLAMGARTHTKGARNQREFGSRFETTEQTVWQARKGATVRKAGWGGRTVWTTEQMLRWAEWFEAELAREKWPTINATEGGIHIAGAKEMTLEQALDRHLRAGFALPSHRPVGAADPSTVRARLLDACGSEDGMKRLLSWERAVLAPDAVALARQELLGAVKKLSELSDAGRTR
ncbi:MAG: 6-hydroxymethylpterin diphosphokinase MptE-like protein [Candidatus Hydrogenedentota bacterium]